MGQIGQKSLQRVRRALLNLEISGVATNLPMHAELMRNDEFVRGGVNTSFSGAVPTG